jgi:hypothetical protein
MWIWIALVLILIGWVYRIREPFEASPYDTVQEQAGAIQQIHDTLGKITISEASIDALQTENDQSTDQISQLQQNMPSDEPSKAYPIE